MDLDKERQIDCWAEYVRTSNGKWKSIHSQFINDYVECTNAFYRNLAKTPRGKKLVIELRGIKNLEAAPMLK